jgi:hypothetical protein
MFDLNLVFPIFVSMIDLLQIYLTLIRFGVPWRSEHFDDSKPEVHKACPKPFEIRPTCPGK